MIMPHEIASLLIDVYTQWVRIAVAKVDECASAQKFLAQGI